MNIKHLLTVLLLVLAVFNFVRPIFGNWKEISTPFNLSPYEKKYNKSQYVIPQSKNPISDRELLTYAGVQYAKGLNPVLINSDHPPFGKYLIGWVTLAFNNNNAPSLIFGILTILLISLLIFNVTQSYLLASLGIFFLSLDTMFLDQMAHGPLMDIIQVFFLVLFFFLFLLWFKKNSILLLILQGIVLGLFSSTKLYFPAFVVLFTCVLFLLFNRKKMTSIILFLATVTGIAFMTYTATYAVYFSKGNSFRNFLGTQKWIFLFWKNNSVKSSDYFANVIPLILFNQWKVWWGNQKYIHFELWSLFWPIFSILGLGSAFYVIKESVITFLKKETMSSPALFFSLWTVLSLAYLCFIPISPRYLMIFYLPVYITITLLIKTLFSKYV